MACEELLAYIDSGDTFACFYRLFLPMTLPKTRVSYLYVLRNPSIDSIIIGGEENTSFEYCMVVQRCSRRSKFHWLPVWWTPSKLRNLHTTGSQNFSLDPHGLFAWATLGVSRQNHTIQEVTKEKVNNRFDKDKKHWKEWLEHLDVGTFIMSLPRTFEVQRGRRPRRPTGRPSRLSGSRQSADEREWMYENPFKLLLPLICTRIYIRYTR